MDNLNMFKELLGKQVCCYKTVKGKDKPILDTKALSFLQIMYPSFKVVKTEFDIYPDEPFIYIGDIKWLPKVQKHTEPHIIVASTGDYNLTDRETLASLVYLRHNKKPPQYLSELIDEKDGWDEDTFYYNMKYAWLTGSVPDRELQKNDLFIKIITNFNDPFNLVTEYLKTIDTLGNEEATKYLEKSLIKFIENSRDTKESTKKGMFLLQQQFHNSCDKNVSSAIQNLIESPIDNEVLRNLNFLLDLVWLNR